MERKRILTGIGAAVGMGMLILDGQTAIAGAKDALELCIRTVIPSLFPFFLLSNLLTSSLGGMSLPLLRPIGRLCRIPHGSEGILLTGLLGGYPVGSQAVSQGFQSGQLSRAQAERMLAFCNNAGPSFLFGIIATCFPVIKYAWLLWGITIVSAILVSLALPASDLHAVEIKAIKTQSLTGAMGAAMKIMATICGWVVLFRIVISFLQRWILWLFPAEIQVLLYGILELTNGCCMLSSIQSLPLRFIACAGMLTFGGLCVTMQTASAIGGLPLKSYLLGKGLQTVFAVSLAVAYVSQSPVIPAVILVVFDLLALAKKQKNSSNPASVGV